MIPSTLPASRRGERESLTSPSRRQVWRETASRPNRTRLMFFVRGACFSGLGRPLLRTPTQGSNCSHPPVNRLHRSAHQVEAALLWTRKRKKKNVRVRSGFLACCGGIGPCTAFPS